MHPHADPLITCPSQTHSRTSGNAQKITCRTYGFRPPSPGGGGGGAALGAGLSRASSLGSVNSLVMLRKSVARCEACLKLDIAAYPDDSLAQAEFKQAFVREMARVLAHLLVQKLDAEGSTRVQKITGQLQR